MPSSAQYDANSAAAERRRRAAQPDGCGDGSGPSQAEGDAGCLLGRGSGVGRLHPQPLVYQGAQRQDVVRGLAWAQAGGLPLAGLRLPRVRQEALATSVSSTTALRECSSATRRARRSTASSTRRHNVCARRATLCSTKGEDGRQ